LQKLESIRSKEYNRKSIQIYSSQKFFRTCINDRTKEEQRAMHSQWKYLGKYGGEFQKMGLRALASVSAKARKPSLVKRSSNNL